jgi:hypothetical protein
MTTEAAEILLKVPDAARLTAWSKYSLWRAIRRGQVKYVPGPPGICGERTLRISVTMPDDRQLRTVGWVSNPSPRSVGAATIPEATAFFASSSVAREGERAARYHSWPRAVRSLPSKGAYTLSKSSLRSNSFSASTLLAAIPGALPRFASVPAESA